MNSTSAASSPQPQSETGWAEHTAPGGLTEPQRQIVEAHRRVQAAAVHPHRAPHGLPDHPVPLELREAWVVVGLADLPLADQHIAARLLLHPPRAQRGEASGTLLSARYCRSVFPELKGRQAGCGSRRVALVNGCVARLAEVGIDLELRQEQVHPHHLDPTIAAKFALRAVPLQWPQELIDARRACASAAAYVDRLEDLVLLIGGQVYTERRQRAYRAEVVAHAVERIEQEMRLPWCAPGSPGHAHAMQMRYFVEALSHHSANIPTVRWEEALRIIPAPPAPLGPEPTDDQRAAHSRAWSRHMSLVRSIHAVRLCPEEPPTPSWRGRTARLTSPLTGLPANIRRVLRPDLWSADATSLHLAIAAWRWGCPEMQAYLVGCQQAGTTIWEAMASDITDATGQIIDAAAAKKHLKVISYSLTYGKGKAALRADAAKRFSDLLHGAVQDEDGEEEEDLSDELVDAYLGLPCMRGLLNARDRWMQHIQDSRGVETVMGRRCDLAYFEDRSALRAEIRSIMATDIQDVEQFLLAPIYDLAAAELKKVTPRMRIICPTHDGLLFRLERCEAYWLEKIRTQFLDACAGFGIVGTDLSYEEPLRGRKTVEKILVEDRTGWVEEQTLAEPVSAPTPLLDLHDDGVGHPLGVWDAMLDDAELGAPRQEDLGLSRVLSVGLHVRRALPLARPNVEEHGLPARVFDARETHCRHGIDGRGWVTAIHKGRSRLERSHHLSRERTTSEQRGVGAEGAGADELVERSHRGFD